MTEGALDFATYLRHIRASADGLLAATRKGPLDAAVPACPKWNLAELVEHTGVVHQRVITGVRARREPTSQDTAGIPPEAGVADWYDALASEMLDLLGSARPDQPAWTFDPNNQTVGFWIRRQAHEVAMHHVDADQATGGDLRYDQALATDGIAEVFELMVPRMANRFGPPDLRAPVLVACTDQADRWLVDAESSDAGWRLRWKPLAAGTAATQAAGSIEGPAQDLLLTLWKRPIATPLRLNGDRAVVDAFLASRLTP